MRCLLCCLLAITGAVAVEPFLLGDLNRGGYAASPLGQLDGKIFFTRDDGIHGLEIWASDGRSLEMIVDLRAGSLGSYPQRVGQTEDRIFFIASDGVRGRSLWSTDGTASGTLRAASMPGGFGGWARALGNLLFFMQKDPTTGIEPWITDGTSGGTRRLADIAPGPASSSVTAVAQAGGFLFMVCGGDLWRTDGTPEGTISLATGMVIRGIAETWVLFSRSGELWRSDGTIAGTYRLHPALNPGRVIRTGDTLVFDAFSTGFGSEIWSSDGTIAGTGILYETQAGAAHDAPIPAFAVGDRIAFWKTNASPAQLWTIGNAGEDPQLLLTLPPGAALLEWAMSAQFIGSRLVHCYGGGLLSVDASLGTNPVLGEWGNQQLSCRFSDRYVYYEIGDAYRSWDGTLAGPTDVDLQELSYAESADHDDLLFGVGSSGESPACFVHAAPSSLSSLCPLGYGSLGSRTNNGGAWACGARAVFPAASQTRTELWRWSKDMQSPEIHRDTSTNADAEVSFIHPPASFAGRMLYFRKPQDSPYAELWSTDGTDAGTFPIPQYTQTARSPTRLVVTASGFAFEDTSPQVGLWFTDGTAAGTVKQFTYPDVSLIDDVMPFRDGVLVSGKPRFEAIKYFMFCANQSLSVIAPADDKLIPVQTAAMGQDFYFFGRSSRSLPSLLKCVWQFGGSRTAATLVKENVDLRGLVATSNRLFFWVGTVLWTSDGTPAGTVALKNLAWILDMPALKVAGSKIYFSARTATLGQEVWVSDGTVAGTRVTKDIRPGAEGSATYHNLLVDGGRVFFNAMSEAEIEELWVSDGSTAGTYPITSGPEHRSGIIPVLRIGELLLHWASAPFYGTEMWAVDVRREPTVAWPQPVAITYGTPLGTAQLQATATWQGSAIEGSFTYDPPAGTILGGGTGQILRVTFTPTDPDLYMPISTSTTIDVERAPQTISFSLAAAVTYGTAPLPLEATASSGLPVAYGIVAGPGRIEGSTVVVEGAGSITVRATQAGDADRLPAPPVERSVSVGTAPLVVRVVDALRPVGVGNPPFAVDLTGLVNGDGLADLGGSLVFTTSATAGSPAGFYPVTASGLTSTDYAISYQAGSLRIAPFAPIDVVLSGRMRGGVTAVAVDAVPAMTTGDRWEHAGQLPLEAGTRVYEAVPATGAATLPPVQITIEQVDIAGGGG